MCEIEIEKLVKVIAEFERFARLSSDVTKFKYTFEYVI